jgi:hypothetical protein
MMFQYYPILVSQPLNFISTETNISKILSLCIPMDPKLTPKFICIKLSHNYKDLRIFHYRLRRSVKRRVNSNLELK